MMPRWALVTASVLVVVAAALVGWTVVERVVADRDLRNARHATVVERARAEQASAALAGARGAVRAVPGLAALPSSLRHVADLDTASVSALEAAVDAGLRGDLVDYNAAVARLNALNPDYDAALESLRVQINAAVVGLDPLTR